MVEKGLKVVEQTEFACGTSAARKAGKSPKKSQSLGKVD